MDELIIYEKSPGNDKFTALVQTLQSFGVAISCIDFTGEGTYVPVCLLNGVEVKKGAYPTKQELLNWLKFPEEFFEDESTGCSLNTDGCCGCGCCYE